MGCACCKSTKLSQGNPSLPSFLNTISPFMGSSGCVIVPGERVIGAMVCGERVWVSWEGTWDSGLAVKPWERGGMVLAGNGYGTVVVTGPISPSDGLRLHPTVFFSSGSGLTADSSAFLDFGLDFAQS
ncbi:hypothetical protein Tco_0944149, partial [Tanacetum coccineum]